MTIDEIIESIENSGNSKVIRLESYYTDKDLLIKALKEIKVKSIFVKNEVAYFTNSELLLLAIVKRHF